MNDTAWHSNVTPLSLIHIHNHTTVVLVQYYE